MAQHAANIIHRTRLLFGVISGDAVTCQVDDLLSISTTKSSKDVDQATPLLGVSSPNEKFERNALFEGFVRFIC